ncbi:MAG: hypothetical protein KJO03_12140 [Gammaproteobacteria bacterium]|nr:hypothetical protein [Gammaproteobacteria bacterium]
MKIALVLLLILTAPTINADEISGHIGGFAGLKLMDSSDWPELNTHFAMAIMFDIKKYSWPLSISLDIFDTGDEYKHDGVGGWFGTRMYYDINASFVLGLDARYSYGKVTLFDKELIAGGLNTGVTAGYQF